MCVLREGEKERARGGGKRALGDLERKRDSVKDRVPQGEKKAEEK